jgi:thiol-disulfide isomerase/thioredoxin
MRGARAVIVACALLGTVDAAAMLAPAGAPPLPEFTQQAPAAWLNSAPLKVADLAGSVVLIDFWTFDCVNCYRSIPWLKDLEQRLGAKGLRVIGIHTPELPQERVPANVAAKVRQFAISHPVMLDADFRYWYALSNEYWPAFYLVDKKGRMRALYVGEIHAGDAQALRIEADIAKLLAEKDVALSASTM